MFRESMVWSLMLGWKTCMGEQTLGSVKKQRWAHAAQGSSPLLLALCMNWCRFLYCLASGRMKKYRKNDDSKTEKQKLTEVRQTTGCKIFQLKALSSNFRKEHYWPDASYFYLEAWLKCTLILKISNSCNTYWWDMNIWIGKKGNALPHPELWCP